jgi:transposase
VESDQKSTHSVGLPPGAGCQRVLRGPTFRLSSGNRRRLGHISKQGNSLLLFHLAMRRGRKIAKIGMARKLAVHLYWMWRKGWDYGQFEKLGSHVGEPRNRHGVQ